MFVSMFNLPRNTLGPLQRQETAESDLTWNSESCFLMFWYFWTPTIKMLRRMLCKDVHSKDIISKDIKVCLFSLITFA